MNGEIELGYIDDVNMNQINDDIYNLETNDITLKQSQFDLKDKTIRSLQKITVGEKKYTRLDIDMINQKNEMDLKTCDLEAKQLENKKNNHDWKKTELFEYDESKVFDIRDKCSCCCFGQITFCDCDIFLQSLFHPIRWLNYTRKTTSNILSKIFVISGYFILLSSALLGFYDYVELRKFNFDDKIYDLCIPDTDLFNKQNCIADIMLTMDINTDSLCTYNSSSCVFDRDSFTLNNKEFSDCQIKPDFNFDKVCKLKNDTKGLIDEFTDEIKKSTKRSEKKTLATSILEVIGGAFIGIGFFLSGNESVSTDLDSLKRIAKIDKKKESFNS